MKARKPITKIVIGNKYTIEGFRYRARAGTRCQGCAFAKDFGKCLQMYCCQEAILVEVLDWKIVKDIPRFLRAVCSKGEYIVKRVGPDDTCQWSLLSADALHVGRASNMAEAKKLCQKHLEGL